MTVTNFKVIIIGGGPVGLICAHALCLAGIEFLVLERRQAVAPDTGASLLLDPQSLRVLHQLGLLDAVLSIGSELKDYSFFTSEGYKFAESEGFRYIKSSLGCGIMAFHRAELVEVMYKRLPDTAKSCFLGGKLVEDIVLHTSGVTVSCVGGDKFEGSIVIGADGVKSCARRLMEKRARDEDPLINWGSEEPYTSTYKCLWCSFPLDTETGESIETQQTGSSVTYITGRRRGWIFLYEKLPLPTKASVSYTEDDVIAFAASHAELPVNHTLKVRDVFDKRLTAGMSDVREGVVKHWSWRRIVLVGDACHAQSPSAAQGLNTGIQDVVVLCNALHHSVSTSPDNMPNINALTQIFQNYQRVRSFRIHYSVLRSAALTRLNSWANLWYYLLARYIMPVPVVQRLVFGIIISRFIRAGIVLNYVFGEEPFRGSLGWTHEISPQGRIQWDTEE